MADRLVADGYLAAGYQYINIDDCWASRTRGADGRLQADPERFPSGIRAIADYVSLLGSPRLDVAGVDADSSTSLLGDNLGAGVVSRCLCVRLIRHGGCRGSAGWGMLCAAVWQSGLWTCGISAQRKIYLPGAGRAYWEELITMLMVTVIFIG